jgi:hypothetical protein
MAKTMFLQIRCSPEDRERMVRVASAEHLDVSTWARRALLQVIERWEVKHAPSLRVAEKEGATYTLRSRPPRQGDKAAGPPKRSPSRKG